MIGFQQQYKVTDREILRILETLKEVRTTLIGQKLRIYTDHKNLTREFLNDERVLRWRLILEEYDPDI